MMTDLRKDCPMRHENGNCTVIGGFCTAVNDPICEGLHSAYDSGYRAAALRAKQERANPKQITNADRIRAMSDEDLAVAVSRGAILGLCDIVCGGDCKAVATFNKTSQQRCVEIVLDWLQQPAEEGCR